MKHENRLTRSTEFKRVRQSGKSFAHPLIVLIAQANQQNITQVGVSASRSFGTAIERNRAKRRLREAMRPYISALPTGWNLVLIARHPLLNADFIQVQSALDQLLRRAKLLNSKNG